MKNIFHTEDYKELSWHDNSLYSISLQVEYESSISDLILDIDYISEWICNTDKTCQFKVAPSDLIFHNITDLKVNIDWGNSGFQVCPAGGIPVDGITREQVKEQKICFDKSYYKWIIKLDIPNQSSFISFGASGFTMKLRKEPVLTENQSLSLNQRK